MLELRFEENTWEPEDMTEAEVDEIIASATDVPEGEDRLIIFRTEPYVDSFLVHYGSEGPTDVRWAVRYTFHEGYSWDRESEEIFRARCLSNPNCMFSHSKIGEVYRASSKAHPEWQLQRYYTLSFRMLDHIYNCLKKNTIKEILYKVGLDELAVWSGTIDEVDLMATKPADIYGGINLKILRSLNCRSGARLLAEKKYRDFILALKKLYPYMFTQPMNDAQCSYLKFLIDGDLTPGEAGRLYKSRSDKLMLMWSDSQYSFFIEMETVGAERRALIRQIEEIDPIYKKYLYDPRWTSKDPLGELKYYLITNREKYDALIRRANRRRDPEWQERNNGYVVRYPQTINDFFRESVYMSNCLMNYIEAFSANETTILFMRRTKDFNQPFITIEIYEGRLVQAYHRFNNDCTPEEAEWIRAYCERHGINPGNFSFGTNEDLLM